MILAANPAYRSLLDNKKGSFQNRVKCTNEHMLNGYKTSLGIATGAGVSAFLGHSILQAGKKVAERPNYAEMLKNAKGLDKLEAGAKLVYSKVQDSAVNLIKNKKVQGWIAKSDGWINKVTKGGINKFGKVFKTKGAKTGLAVAVIGTTLAVLGGIIKGAYKSGKIDQKYNDKAKTEKDMMAAQSLKKDVISINAQKEQDFEAFLQKFAEMK